MEWQLALLILFGGMIVLMLSGMPLAFGILAINVLGALVWLGGGMGMNQLVTSITTGLTSFTLLPAPLFILMGEVMLHSGLSPKMISAIDDWVGRVPGRLGLLAVAAGTLFATFTGAGMASTAMLGRTLVPEMEKRGYKKPMSLGPILGSGGLAMMIPPSGMAILMGAIGEISIGGLLMGIIIPGILMAILYVSYIVLRCKFQPDIAPPYIMERKPLMKKIGTTAKYILPLGAIIFLVIGVIMLGIATPSESAACGAMGTFILAACYGRLNWDMVKKALSGSMLVVAMVMMIVVSAITLSQILAFSGASSGLVKFAANLPVSPIFVLIFMQLMVLILGMFMPSPAIIMVAIPLFMPIVDAMGFNPVWFGVITLMNLEVATTSPPFGSSLFVMKAVAPEGTTIGDCYRAALPFLYCDIISITLVIAFPVIALWLPSAMPS